MSLGLAFLVGLEAAALLEQVVAPNGTGTTFSFEALDKSFYELLRPLSPGLFLVLLYVLPSSFLIGVLKSRSGRLSTFIKWLSRPYSKISENLSLGWKGTNTAFLKRPLLLLLIALAAGCLLAYTPYRPDLNPQGTPLGEDTVHYIVSVSQMLGKAPSDALYYAFREDSFNGSRPFLFILLYAVASLASLAADVVVKFQPLVLGPLLAASSYFFVYAGLKDKEMAALVSLLSAFSFQFTVGMWAGYYANWLGLVEAYVILGAFLSFSTSFSKNNYLIMFGFSLALLFTHPWTWAFLLILLVAGVVDNYLRTRETGLVRPISLLIIANVLADITRALLVGGYGGSGAVVDVAASRSGILQVPLFFQNLAGTVLLSYDGSIANSVAVGFAILGIWGLHKARDGFSRLIVFWTLIVAVAEPFLQPLIQTRLLYLLPLPVLASGGLLAMQKMLNQRLGGALIFMFLILFSANVTLRSLVQL